MSSWIEAIDPDSNNKYWYNSLTGESTWSDPNDINNDNNNVIETSSSVESASAVSAASYWIEAVDPTTNNIYYYNTLTGESSWDKPLELVNEELNNNNNDDNNNIEEPPLDWIQETDEETNRTFLINPLTNLKGWEIVYDHTSGLFYYWDEAAGNTTWDRPIFQYDTNVITEIGNTENVSKIKHQKADDSFLSQVLSPSTLDKLQTISQSNTSSFISTSLLALLSLNPLSTSPKRSISSRNNSLDENEELFYSNLESKSNEFANIEKVDLFDSSKSDFRDFNTINISSIVSKMKDYSLKQYAEKYFDIDKNLSPAQINEAINNKLTWKSEQLKEPLCSLSKGLAVEAIACSKHISSFVGERKTEKNQMHHAIILLEHMLKAPKELRDEIYCQIAKKIEGNPSFENTWSAWQLLVFCFATFPPSNELYKPLLGFLCNNIDGGGYNEFRKLAEFSLKSCILSSKCPSRKQIPSLNELNILRGAESVISVRVHYLDEEILNIVVNCWTLAKDFNDIIVKTIELKPERADAFGLFIEHINGTHKVLEPDERITDVIANIDLDDEQDMKYKLVYKVKYFFDDDSNLYSDDPVAFNLYYAQAVNDVYSGKYPCTKVDYLVLSALRAQEKFGDNLPILEKEGNNNNNNNNSKDNVTDNFFWQLIVPPALIDNDKSNSLKQFFRIHKRLKGYSCADAKSAFMDHVRSFKVYGSHFFFAKYNANGDIYSNIDNNTSPMKRSDDNNNTNQSEDVVIAISNTSLTVIQVETTFILLQFKYDQNLTWVYSNKSIIIMISSDDGKSRKRYYLKTNQGKEINNFLNIYTNRRKVITD